MKKIIGIVIASLLFCNIGYTEMKRIEHEIFNYYHLSTVCVDGYKYVVASTNAGNVSVVQLYRDFNNAAVPAEC